MHNIVNIIFGNVLKKSYRIIFFFLFFLNINIYAQNNKIVYKQDTSVLRLAKHDVLYSATVDFTKNYTYYLKTLDTVFYFYKSPKYGVLAYSDKYIMFVRSCGTNCGIYEVFVFDSIPHWLCYSSILAVDYNNHYLLKSEEHDPRILIVVDFLSGKIIWSRQIFKNIDACNSMFNYVFAIEDAFLKNNFISFKIKPQFPNQMLMPFYSSGQIYSFKLAFRKSKSE